jgi:membrane protein DedA with SNARE-associated domain
VLGTTAPLLIVAGRFVPGVRFAVNAMMGLSSYPYPRFLLYSSIGSWLWPGYTCVFSWWIGTKLGDWPILSMLVSALITAALLSLLYFPLKKRYEASNARQAEEVAESAPAS